MVIAFNKGEPRTRRRWKMPSGYLENEGIDERYTMVAEKISQPSPRRPNAVPIVLIVDGDVRFARMLGSAFLNRGFQVRICSNPQQALKTLRMVPIDIIVTELWFGSETSLSMIEAASCGDTPASILVLTAFGSVKAAVATIKAGATEFLSKPSEIEMILRVLGLPDAQTRPEDDRFCSPEVVRWKHVTTIFESSGQNVMKTARRLNMHRRTLQRMLARGRPRTNITLASELSG